MQQTETAGRKVRLIERLSGRIISIIWKST